MMNTFDIDQTGTKYAGDWLRRSGYEVKHSNEVAGGVEIEADHPSAKILVHLKIAVFPAQHKELTSEEGSGLKLRALQSGRRPYAATVMIDAQGHLVRDAQWQALPH